MIKSAFRFAVLLYLLVLPVTVHAGYEDSAKKDPFYAEIVKTAQTMHGIEFIHFLNAKMDEDISRVHPISIWLRDNSIAVKDPAKINSLYFLPYSDVTFLLARSFKGTDKNDAYNALGKSAMMTLYTYEAMAMADAVRCDDQSALGGVALNTMRERLVSPEIIATYKDFKKSDFDLFAEMALTVEEKFAGRPKNEDICDMGVVRMEVIKSLPGAHVNVVDDPDYPGGKRTEIIPPEGYVYHPEFVSDETWQKNRQRLRSEMMEAWADRYAQNAGTAGTPEKKP